MATTIAAQLGVQLPIRVCPIIRCAAFRTPILDREIFGPHVLIVAGVGQRHRHVRRTCIGT
ncbi:MAG: hypothetical protein ACRDRY_24395 [Pseudonocardiaceae bacterium]